MKRFLSLVLACMLTLTLAVTALAEPYYLEAAGLTLEVPEGMTVQDMSADGSYLLAITVDADPNLKYAFALSFIEEFEGKSIEDLTEEEAKQIMQGIAIAIPDPQFDTAETEMLNMLLVASADGSQLHYITLQGGWLFDAAVGRADGPLTPEEIQVAADLLFSLQFDGE